MVSKPWDWVGRYLHLLFLEVQPGRQGLALFVGRVMVVLEEPLQLIPLYHAVHRALPSLPLWGP